MNRTLVIKLCDGKGRFLNQIVKRIPPYDNVSSAERRKYNDEIQGYIRTAKQCKWPMRRVEVHHEKGIDS